MRFSEEEVFVFGVVFALLTSVLILVPCVRYMLKWYWSHPRKESYKEMIPRVIVCIITCVVSMSAISKLCPYSSVLWFVLLGTIFECLALYPFFNRINGRFMVEYADSFNEEEGKDPGRIHKYMIYYMMGFVCLQNMVLSMVGTALASWVMPDVVEVRNGPGGASYAYDVSDYYVFPYYGGLKPGGSYIYNFSEDTVYRVVVTYGIQGEDKSNHYAIKEKYPPHSFSEMRGRVVHVMDTIAPWMPVSYDIKAGYYRTQRVYLTDGMHLYDFMSARMRQFGLYDNERVDAIEESRNMSLRENLEKYRAYKAIDPYPYPRLRPDSIRRKYIRKNARSRHKRSNHTGNQNEKRQQ